MSAKPLTKREEAWIARVQKALDACPSKRIGFYTIGDNDVMLYDCSMEEEILAHNDRTTAEFGGSVDAMDAWLGSFSFPNGVHSVAG